MEHLNEHHRTELPKDMLNAGTGEMQCLSVAMTELQSQGYTTNLTLKYDHFESEKGDVKLYPHDLFFDDVIRFENTSDPDDQSILYAISSVVGGIKGIYVESYGLYHEEISQTMIERMKFCHSVKQEQQLKAWRESAHENSQDNKNENIHERL